MSSWRDRFNKMTGRTRFVVSRLFVHLVGEDVAPLLGVLNECARQAIDSEGDMEVLGQSLETICQNLIQLKNYWQSAANEGNVFWEEGEAGDYVTELFTDSSQRYLSEGGWGTDDQDLGADDRPFSLTVTRNLVVMITVAAEGEAPDLETDLASLAAMDAGLKSLINLHYQGRLRAIQVHFSPAKLGDELTDEQVLVNFPELIPL